MNKNIEKLILLSALINSISCGDKNKNNDNKMKKDYDQKQNPGQNPPSQTDTKIQALFNKLNDNNKGKFQNLESFNKFKTKVDESQINIDDKPNDLIDKLTKENITKIIEGKSKLSKTDQGIKLDDQIIIKQDDEKSIDDELKNVLSNDEKTKFEDYIKWLKDNVKDYEHEFSEKLKKENHDKNKILEDIKNLCEFYVKVENEKPKIQTQKLCNDLKDFYKHKILNILQQKENKFLDIDIKCNESENSYDIIFKNKNRVNNSFKKGLKFKTDPLFNNFHRLNFADVNGELTGEDKEQLFKIFPTKENVQSEVQKVIENFDPGELKDFQTIVDKTKEFIKLINNLVIAKKDDTNMLDCVGKFDEIKDIFGENKNYYSVINDGIKSKLTEIVNKIEEIKNTDEIFSQEFTYGQNAWVAFNNAYETLKNKKFGSKDYYEYVSESCTKVLKTYCDGSKESKFEYSVTKNADNSVSHVHVINLGSDLGSDKVGLMRGCFTFLLSGNDYNNDTDAIRNRSETESFCNNIGRAVMGIENFIVTESTNVKGDLYKMFIESLKVDDTGKLSNIKTVQESDDIKNFDDFVRHIEQPNIGQIAIGENSNKKIFSKCVSLDKLTENKVDKIIKEIFQKYMGDPTKNKALFDAINEVNYDVYNPHSSYDVTDPKKKNNYKFLGKIREKLKDLTDSLTEPLQKEWKDVIENVLVGKSGYNYDPSDPTKINENALVMKNTLLAKWALASSDSNNSNKNQNLSWVKGFIKTLSEGCFKNNYTQFTDGTNTTKVFNNSAGGAGDDKFKSNKANCYFGEVDLDLENTEFIFCVNSTDGLILDDAQKGIFPKDIKVITVPNNSQTPVNNPGMIYLKSDGDTPMNRIAGMFGDWKGEKYVLQNKYLNGTPIA